MKKKALSVILFGIVIIAPVHAFAQKDTAMHRIGILHAGSAPDVNADIFIDALRPLGYSEGKNLYIEHRFAQGKTERLPELARELVQARVNAMFAGGAPAAIALKQASKTVPSIFV